MPTSMQSGPHVDITDQEIDSAIAACGGDPREAIRALLVGQAWLQADIEAARRGSCAGFSRKIPGDRKRPS